MIFIDIIYYLTIRPLEILFETIFFISYRFIGKPFATIIALSLFVNILVFPLYKRADKLQATQREREKSMEEKLSHIKKTFKGDEKVMMTQAYYRICDYKPVYALRGASSLLLQIPFFISAYRFLSGLDLLKGMPSILMSFPWNGGNPAYLIKDLGAPDAMFSVSGHGINVLPILMTLINIVSGTIYSKGHLRKEKVQLYVTALVFLVLLYNSPAGLVVYWTCNNLLSLLKNVLQKLFEKKTGKLIANNTNVKSGKKTQVRNFNYNKVFLSCALFMAVLTGLYIPSNVLSPSSTEFISLYDNFNPSRYLIYSLCLGIGFYVVWVGVYYLFSPDKIRKIIVGVLSVICCMGVINYMMSGSGLGTISTELKYDSIPSFSFDRIMLNLALLVVSTLIMTVIFVIRPGIAGFLAMAGCVSFIVASGVNIHVINSDYRQFLDMYSDSDRYDKIPKIRLSRTGKNVVVLMLDRALGPCVPFIIYERPDVLEKLDGFTFYYNTVSYGRSTNIAMPAVFGGYEYTPYELNKRDDELLSDKNDEALRVLPVLFDNNGYGVTVIEPPLAGYSQIPDLSIYDDHPNIDTYISKGKFIGDSLSIGNNYINNLKRNLFYFGEMKSVPLCLQGILYNNGNYNCRNVRSISNRAANTSVSVFEEGEQNPDSLTIADGVPTAFMEWYMVLDNMPNITEISDNEVGEFTMMYNCTTHEPTLLQLPGYTPQEHVDNSAYVFVDHYDLGGQIMKMDDIDNVMHYHVNVASFMELGKWFDYLKAEGVYDNTRIILVGDHGIGVRLFDGFFFGKQHESCEWYMPLYMVKDFDSHGFEFSWDFMTNADTCPMAVEGVVEDPVNPFTGNALDGHEKKDDIVRIFTSDEWDIKKNNGYTFIPGDWYTVDGTPYDTRNWKYLEHK